MKKLFKTYYGIIHRVKSYLFYELAFNATMLIPPLKGEYNTIGKLIDAILQIMIKVGTPIVALFLIYAGFMFVTSAGDSKKLDTAKSIFLWTVVGAALILGALTIETVLTNTIGNIINN